uniref:Protein F37C4.5 n=1 Tax=Schistocephalus solidus TaxID=70667 RepID=A0A0X3PE15_SCHSO
MASVEFVNEGHRYVPEHCGPEAYDHAHHERAPGDEVEHYELGPAIEHPQVAEPCNATTQAIAINEALPMPVPVYQAQFEPHSFGIPTLLDAPREHEGYQVEEEEEGGHKTFQDIRQDLEKRNLSGSLQPQPATAAVISRTSNSTKMEDQQQGFDQAVPQGHMSTPNAALNGEHHFAHHRPPIPNRGDEQDTLGRKERSRNSGPAGIAQVRQTLALPDLQLNHVTVFTDRAELCRSITPVFKAGEIVEMLFENISSALDKDSIRVELRGAATILDVMLNTRPLAELEETWSQSVADLQTELRHCQRQTASLTGKLQRLEKQRAVLDTFADGLTKQNEADGEAAIAAALPPLSPGPQPYSDKHHGKKTVEPEPSPRMPERSASEFGSRNINPFDPMHMDTLQRFLNVYEDQAERLDTNLLSTKEELERMRERTEQIEKELADLEKRQEEHAMRELSVLIEPREDGPVEMLITYVVTRCLWKPAYDIRLFNSDGSMKIIYYGMVQQTTGEDWEPKRMTLSTAQPSSCGLVPTLGLQRLHYKQSVNKLANELPTSASTWGKKGKQHQRRLSSTVSVSRQGDYAEPPPFDPSLMAEAEFTVRGNYLVATLPRSPRAQSVCAGDTKLRRSSSRPRSQLSQADESPRPIATPMSTLQRAMSTTDGQASQRIRGSSISRATSRQGLGTSLLLNTAADVDPSHAVASVPPQQPPVATVLFEVPRPPALVPCTNEEVRVTVGLLDIQPQYDYVTVPKRSLSTFLKAHARNTSNFYILPGPTNIYSDNTFIGKSELNSVAPGEDFSCNLGAESGIEVIYRPMFKAKEVGSGSSQKASVTFKQIIDVHNTFQRPVKVTVVDQLPASGEDKIKVSLLEPTIKHPEKYDRSKPIRMNRNNNIEWDIELHPGESRELTLRFSVEYPAVEELEVCVAEA